MLSASTERPAWLTTIKNAFQHRYISTKAGLRIMLIDYYKKSGGEHSRNVRCDTVNK